MPRQRLKDKIKRSEVTFIKLRAGERGALDALSTKRRSKKAGRWTRSDIMRDAFLFYLWYAEQQRAGGPMKLKVPAASRVDAELVAAELGTA
jgi:hypothetical protein